jgi:hypothetical protein
MGGVQRGQFERQRLALHREEIHAPAAEDRAGSLPGREQQRRRSYYASSISYWTFMFYADVYNNVYLLSIKHSLLEIQPLPRAANSRQWPINRRQRLCRRSHSAQASRIIFSQPRLFAEHPSSRLSAQPVPRAHSGPSAKKKVAVNGGVS